MKSQTKNNMTSKIQSTVKTINMSIGQARIATGHMRDAETVYNCYADSNDRLFISDDPSDYLARDGYRLVVRAEVAHPSIMGGSMEETRSDMFLAVMRRLAADGLTCENKWGTVFFV